MTTLFINGSPNKNGNTVALAKKLLGDQSFETLHLADYKIYDYGQDFSDDQFEEVLAKVFEADTIVIGSPVYWHSINGLVRNFLDRQCCISSFKAQLRRRKFLIWETTP